MKTANKTPLLVAGGGLLALSLATTASLGGAYATDGDSTQTDDVIVTVESSCSLATSGTSLDPASTYTANITNGAYNTNIAGSTFTITCNDTAGWHLYEVGYTNDTWGTTYMDASTNVASDDIPTGTTLDGTVSNWASKYAKGGSDAGNITITTGYTDFSAIPSSPVSIASGTSTAGNSTITATYGAGISPTQSAGSYTGKVLYTLVHPASANGHTIAFDLAGGTGASTSVVVPLGTTTTLPTPTKTGYIFQGWYTAPTGGTKIGDGGDFYTPTGNVKLYAQWEEQPTMQDFSCSSLSAGATTTLTDSRDDNSYMVGKLADGKCWMLDNLAFNGKDNQGNGSYITMDSTNTHINTSKTWSDTVRTGWTSSSQNSYTASYINDASKGIIPSDARSQAGGYKIGVYYNYCAATLDTICSSSTTAEASYDVCPKGWKLPIGDTSGDFQTLYSRSEYNTYDKYRAALRLPLSGYFSSGSPSGQGSFGYWWSTTAYGDTTRRDLGINSATIYPAVSASYDDRSSYGISIRCISNQ